MGWSPSMTSVSGDGLQWAFVLVGSKTSKADHLGQLVEDALVEGNLIVLNSQTPHTFFMVIGGN